MHGMEGGEQCNQIWRTGVEYGCMIAKNLECGAHQASLCYKYAPTCICGPYFITLFGCLEENDDFWDFFQCVFLELNELQRKERSLGEKNQLLFFCCEWIGYHLGRKCDQVVNRCGSYYEE